MNKHAANKQTCTHVPRERIHAEYGITIQIFPELPWSSQGQIEQQQCKENTDLFPKISQ